MTEPSLDVLREIFNAAPFIASLGIELESATHGECRTVLRLRPDHLQQTGVVHAGVIAAIADHTAGGAAGSVLNRGFYPLTIEFKINLLRPASGDRITCHSRVLKAGRSVIVAESDVFASMEGGEVLAAKAIVSLAVRMADENRRPGSV